MWCQHCRQDVRGIASPDKPGAICTRCGGRLIAEGQFEAAHTVGVGAAAASGLDLGKKPPLAPYPSFDDWKVEQSVRELQARIGSPRRAPKPSKPSSEANRAPKWRVDAAHRGPTRPHTAKPDPSRHSSLFARFVLWLGLMGFASGVCSSAGRSSRRALTCGALVCP